MSMVSAPKTAEGDLQVWAFVSVLVWFSGTFLTCLSHGGALFLLALLGAWCLSRWAVDSAVQAGLWCALIGMAAGLLVSFESLKNVNLTHVNDWRWSFAIPVGVVCGVALWYFVVTDVALLRNKDTEKWQ